MRLRYGFITSCILFLVLICGKKYLQKTEKFMICIQNILNFYQWHKENNKKRYSFTNSYVRGEKTRLKRR